MCLNQELCNGEITLDYLGGPDVIIIILQTQKRGCDDGSRGWSDGLKTEEGSQSEQCR